MKFVSIIMYSKNPKIIGFETIVFVTLRKRITEKCEHTRIERLRLRLIFDRIQHLFVK